MDAQHTAHSVTEEVGRGNKTCGGRAVVHVDVFDVFVVAATAAVGQTILLSHADPWGRSFC